MKYKIGDAVILNSPRVRERIISPIGMITNVCEDFYGKEYFVQIVFVNHEFSDKLDIVIFREELILCKADELARLLYL